MLASFAEFRFVQGNWNARISSAKNALGVSLNTLGFLLLGGGALVAMSATGWIQRRWSSMRLPLVASAASCAARLAAAWTTVH